MIAAARNLLAPVVAMLSSGGEPTAKMLESVALLNQILDEHRDDLAAYLQALAASATNPSLARRPAIPAWRHGASPGPADQRPENGRTAAVVGLT